MQPETQKLLKSFYKILEKERTYSHALGVMYFDLETICPDKAKEDESDVLDYFANQSFKLKNSDRAKSLIVELYARRDELDELDRVLIDKEYEEYLKTKNFTPQFDLQLSRVFSRAGIDWHRAKEASDFSLFRSSLGKVIEYSAKAVDKRENKLPSLYDNLLDDCEKGVLQADLDGFFAELKEGLIDLINRIKNSKHAIRTDFLSRKAPVYKQQQFSEYLLSLNGFDFTRGCLTTTEHPFTSDVAHHDARVTTHYYEDMVLSNIYSVIHEGGHAIFMQNEPDEDYDHYINDSITNGMHESVSRFYENVIGRSRAYVKLIFPKFREIFAQEFSDVTEEEFYEAINVVTPSLIRTEADEVTYGLHIVIRYEMEKMICSGAVSLDEIPATWNRLYKEYLGVEPTCDRDGVLQDVHWSGGFGYFPSYALGNAYNAMYLEEIKKDLDFYALIESGDFDTVNKWMRTHVFAKANRLTPKEWIVDITGKSLTPKPFLDYLNEKYKDIYRL